MIANMSSEISNIDETISTARFASRCSLLVNEIRINEQLNLEAIIERLKAENESLKLLLK